MNRLLEGLAETLAPSPQLEYGGLDLTCMGPQLYVAGLPWRRQTEIRSQRNNLNELGRYLERTFPDKYMVFNLVPFEAGAQYNYDAFRGQVALHNVDPGKGCPELRQLFPLVAALDAWLNLSVRNVAVLHEHNGHARCALVLAAYLLFSRQCDNPDEALDLYRRRRPQFTALSATYRRFLLHFNQLLQFGGELPNHCPLKLHKLIVHRKAMASSPQWVNGNPGVGASTRFTLEVFQKDVLVFSSDNCGAQYIVVDDFTFGFNVDVTVVGSILFRLVATTVHDDSHTDAPGHRVVLFRIGLHTGFLPAGAFRVENRSMDRGRGLAATEHGPQIVAADFVFSSTVAPPPTGADRLDPVQPDFEVMPSFADGLSALSESHIEIAPAADIAALTHQGFDAGLAALSLQRHQSSMLEAHAFCKHVATLSVWKRFLGLGRDECVPPSSDAVGGKIGEDPVGCLTPAVVDPSGACFGRTMTIVTDNTTVPLTVEIEPTAARDASRKKKALRRQGMATLQRFQRSRARHSVDCTVLPPVVPRSTSATRLAPTELTPDFAEASVCDKSLCTEIGSCVCSPTPRDSSSVCDPHPVASPSSGVSDTDSAAHWPSMPGLPYMDALGDTPTPHKEAFAGPSESDDEKRSRRGHEVLSTNVRPSALGSHGSNDFELDESLPPRTSTTGNVPGWQLGITDWDDDLDGGTAASVDPFLPSGPTNASIPSVPLPATVSFLPPRRPPTPDAPAAPLSMPPQVNDPPPPPPMPGSAPPPPPIPGQSKVPTGPPVPTLVSTSKLHWSTVPKHALRDTVWSEIPQHSGDSVSDAGSIEEKFANLFCQDASSMRRAPAARQVKRIQAPKFGSTQRLNNVAIALKRFESLMPNHTELVNSVLEFDETVFSLDSLYMFRRLLPTDDELTVVRRLCAAGIPSGLSNAEGFFVTVAVANVNMVKATDAFIFTLEFTEKYVNIRGRLANFLLACTQLQSSRALKALLGMALQLGNMANTRFAPASRWSAPAHGFKIDALDKLSDIKGKKMNLQQFLVATVRSDSPHLLCVVDELTHLESARHCDLDQLQSEISTLEQAFASTKAQTRAFPPTFAKRIETFLTANQASLTQIVDDYQTCATTALAILKYFGASESKPADLFSRLHAFSELFRHP
eukprot:m.316401 g.316401  ORF g.316401 m.316401 type:complete len:1146 (+) comp27545_c0_seq2:50-3487(+)